MISYLNMIGLKFAKIISFSGIGLIICLVLLDTKHEISFQNTCFIFGTGVLLLASMFTILFTHTRPRLNIIDILVLALGVLVVINYNFITQVNIEGKFINLILLGITYISLRIIFSAYKNARSFAIISIAFCGLIESIYGITQLLGLSASNHSLYSMTGTFFNPGPYGGYLAIIMAASIAYIVRYSGWFTRYSARYIKNPKTWLKHPAMIGCIVCYCAFILSFIIFFAIMSRAAILAFIVSLFVLFLMTRSVRNKVFKYIKFNRIKAILLLSVILFVVCSSVYYAYNFKQNSADGRIFLWKVANKIIAEHPITGVGIGAYCGAYAEVQANYFFSNPNSDFTNVAGAPEYGFNEYLQIGAELGVLGMMLFIVIMGVSIYFLIRKKNVLTYGLLALVVFAFFSYPLSLLPFQILVIVFITISSSFKNIHIKSKFTSLSFMAVLAILCFIYLQYGNIYTKKIVATLEWEKVQKLYRNEDFERAIIEYDKIYPSMKDNPRYLFEYGHALNMIGEFEKSNKILKEGVLLSSDPMFPNIIGNNFKGLGLFEKAENSYVFAYYILPDRMYSVYLLMKLYERTEQKDKMVNMAKIIVSFKSKVESSATNNMREDAAKILSTQKD